jgi:hypothetical protein
MSCFEFLQVLVISVNIDQINACDACDQRHKIAHYSWMQSFQAELRMSPIKKEIHIVEQEIALELAKKGENGLVKMSDNENKHSTTHLYVTGNIENVYGTKYLI